MPESQQPVPQNGVTASSTPNSWRESSDALSDSEEQRVLFSTLDSFRQYRRNAHYNTTHRRRQSLYALPQQQLKLLTTPPFSLLDKLSIIDDAVDVNAEIADAILARGLHNFNITPGQLSTHPPSSQSPSDSEQHTKAHSTIRQFYRDWTAEGFAAEVAPLLSLILTALKTHSLPPSPSTHILLPGAGLGRLLFELILAGYSATGNEISFHPLLASDFILNTTPSANSYTIYPFIAQFNNNPTRSHQLRSYTIPDIHPATALAHARAAGRPVGEMGMAAGDFLTSFSDADSIGSFSAVVTHYFIDTAPNLIRYIDTIRNCLKPNGLWVNCGPLLWHFDNNPQAKDKVRHNDKLELKAQTSTPAATEDGDGPIKRKDEGIAAPGSFELAADEVRDLVEHLGFKIEEHSIIPDGLGGYMQDPDSMLQYLYRNSFWVARKLG